MNPLDLTNPTAKEALDVKTSGVITTQNAQPAGVATANSAVEIDTDGKTTLTIQTAGTYTGALSVQGAVDANSPFVTLGGQAVLNENTGATAGTIASGTQAIFQVDVSGFERVRVTGLSAMTGSVTVYLRATQASAMVALGAPIPSGSNVIGAITNLIPGVGATNLGKAEDAVAASGDTGLANLGVRVPTTPAAQTSAAGDYGMLAIDAEGKLIASQYSATDHYWQSSALTLNSTTSTAMKAAAAAGVRNYLTDIDIANTSATGVRVDVLDGATVIASFWSPPTSHVQHSYSIPKKGTAATALNVQLSAAVTDVRVSANGYIGV
jgi:hypothetical protein